MKTGERTFENNKCIVGVKSSKKRTDSYFPSCLVLFFYGKKIRGIMIRHFILTFSNKVLSSIFSTILISCTIIII